MYFLTLETGKKGGTEKKGTEKKGESKMRMKQTQQGVVRLQSAVLWAYKG